MPTYEYKCTNDGSTFDLWQEVGSAAPPCPNCGAPTKKVFQPPRVIFKGSGFYVTDLRAEGGGKSGGGKSGGSQTTETKTEEKSVATPTETKAETKTDAPKVETKTTKAD